MGATREQPPDFSEPKKWAFRHLLAERHHLTAAPVAFAIIGLGGLVLGWILTWQIVVPSKNASIETLQISAADKQSKIDELRDENLRISKQNVELKSAIAESATPLKKRTLILAAQLSDYGRRCSTNADITSQQEEYMARFQYRLSKTISDLDEAGKHSEVLSKMFDPLSLPIPETNVQTIVQELQKLAKSLKDDTDGSLAPIH